MLYAFRSLVLLALALAAGLAHAQEALPPAVLTPATLQAWQARPLTWRTYAGATQATAATVYANEGRDSGPRPFTVVLVHDEANRAPITEDARHLAELVGRELGVDPVRLAFVFRYAVAGSRRPLSIRATFRRATSGGLVSPSWRVLSGDEVEDYTGRALR